MARTALLLFALAGCCSIALGAFCHGKPSPTATGNSIPINTAAPTLVRTHTNGKAYQAGTPGHEFWVIHVWGTPYEQGLAQGQMMKAEASAFISKVWAYMESQITSSLGFLPAWLQQDLANAGLDIALDWEYEMTKNFTGSYFYEELQGLADGSGVDFDTLKRVHLIGELTKGDCSMYGAWGKATASTGKTMQLRALDWDIDGPFQDFSAVTVYHPGTTGIGHPFANVGFVGFIGALTGMSAEQMAISEIGVSYPDETFGKESRAGVPFTYLLRDILQFDNTLNDTITRIQTANRTCDLILGAGDGKMQTFRGFEYSASTADVIGDKNLRPVASWHPPMEDVVYWGMDWLCPGYTQVLSEQLTRFYGNITADNTIHEILPITQTGNLHIAVYDLTAQIMYVSFGRPSNSNVGAFLAYDRQFTQIDMKALFAVTL